MPIIIDGGLGAGVITGATHGRQFAVTVTLFAGIVNVALNWLFALLITTPGEVLSQPKNVWWWRLPASSTTVELL